MYYNAESIQLHPLNMLLGRELGKLELSLRHHLNKRLELQTIHQQIFWPLLPTRSFSCSKANSSAFTFKTLLRHFAKWALTPQSLNVKLGPRHNYHKGQAAIRHYANQTARPL